MGNISYSILISDRPGLRSELVSLIPRLRDKFEQWHTYIRFRVFEDELAMMRLCLPDQEWMETCPEN